MFVILLSYTAPLAEIDRHLADHRAFLARQYAKGVFLMSGPCQPRTGGVIIARCEAREVLEQLIAQDPFHVAGVANYQIVEFSANRCAAGLEAFCQS